MVPHSVDFTIPAQFRKSKRMCMSRHDSWKLSYGRNAAVGPSSSYAQRLIVAFSMSRRRSDNIGPVVEQGMYDG